MAISPEDTYLETGDQDLYKSLLDNLYDGVYFADTERKICYWNRGAERITGFSYSEVLGRHCWDNLLVHINERGVSLCQGNCPLAQTIRDGELREAQVYLHHKDGHRVPVLVRIAPLKDREGRILGGAEIFSDNSAHVALLQKVGELQELALLDALTGLGNRRYIEINLNTRIDELVRYGWPFGIIFIDIDRFKQVNDRYGHQVGDEILKMVSRTLLNNIRSFDFVGRWGGEEFAISIVNVNEEQLYEIAEKFRILVENSSLHRESEDLSVTVSIGAALGRPHDTADSLLERADQLLYQSKSSGRNRVSVVRGDASPIKGMLVSDER
jgi:diguanylate cyclase (GGDEF)-like protein/PAS domain S-box-containing protein